MTATQSNTIQAESSMQRIADKQQQRLSELRGMVNEVVGVTFFGQMLKMAQNNPFKANYMQGGRGEDMFRGQLNMELAGHVGRGVHTGLGENIYNQLSRYVKAEDDQSCANCTGIG